MDSLGDALAKDICLACYYRIDFTEFQTLSFKQLSEKQLLDDLSAIKLEESTDPKA